MFRQAVVRANYDSCIRTEPFFTQKIRTEERVGDVELDILSIQDHAA
jgi:hypothetical protein